MLLRQSKGFPALYGAHTCETPPDKWVLATTAWRVLGLRMEERPLDMEGSCEYIE